MPTPPASSVSSSEEAGIAAEYAERRRLWATHSAMRSAPASSLTQTTEGFALATSSTSSGPSSIPRNSGASCTIAGSSPAAAISSK